MSTNRKRKAEEANLEQANDQWQKRANDLCESEVKKAMEMVEVAINKMTPQERQL